MNSIACVYFGTSEHYWVVKKKRKRIILISKTAIVGCCKLSLYANCLVMSIRFIFSDDWMTCPFNHVFDLWQWCNFSGIEALEFSCLYTRIQPVTADVFPVVANTRTKSIQKQVKSINVNKGGSEKHLASKSVSFCVELITSSFLDLIFKQARLNATVSGFLLLLILI